MWIPCLPGLRFWTSATTCTSSPTFVNVTVPVTWLPDFGSNCTAAFVTSCAWAKQATPQNIVMQRIVFMLQTYRASPQNETVNRVGVAQFRCRRQHDGRARTASASDVHSPAPNQFRPSPFPHDRPNL